MYNVRFKIKNVDKVFAVWSDKESTQDYLNFGIKGVGDN